MATVGRYAKAYAVDRFRQFGSWTENLANLRKVLKDGDDGEEIEVARDFGEEEFFLLHENLVVTDGIFMDENIIFDDVTPEWKAFCEQELGFAIPDWITNDEHLSADEVVASES
jgi:hypothetical protein